ncbi:hypothetical protein [Serratia marcescens]|uniref:hypothetical protein n=1 Tax=Serratia marcescens TaxID=615 RepID=UPI003D7737B4
MSDKKNPAIMAGKTGMVCKSQANHIEIKGFISINVHTLTTSKKKPAKMAGFFICSECLAVARLVTLFYQDKMVSIMQTTTCRECDRTVGKNEKKCPHCGIDYPWTRPWHGCLTIIVFFIIVIALIYYFFFSGKARDTQPQPVATTTESVNKPVKKAEKSTTDCNPNDGQCLYNKYLLDVNYPCQKLVERAAKYEYEWTDGLIHPAISRFYYDRKKGLIKYIGDRVKFTNAFNAKSNMIYSCTFSIKQRKIVDFDIEEGRF